MSVRFTDTKTYELIENSFFEYMNSPNFSRVRAEAIYGSLICGAAVALGAEEIITGQALDDAFVLGDLVASGRWWWSAAAERRAQGDEFNNDDD